MNEFVRGDEMRSSPRAGRLLLLLPSAQRHNERTLTSRPQMELKLTPLIPLEETLSNF
jgi:hypothetical protein